MEPGSIEWLDARIKEHQKEAEMLLHSANGHAGARQAYERLKEEKLVFLGIREQNKEPPT